MHLADLITYETDTSKVPHQEHNTICLMLVDYFIEQDQLDKALKWMKRIIQVQSYKLDSKRLLHWLEALINGNKFNFVTLLLHHSQTVKNDDVEPKLISLIESCIQKDNFSTLLTALKLLRAYEINKPSLWNSVFEKVAFSKKT